MSYTLLYLFQHNVTVPRPGSRFHTMMMTCLPTDYSASFRWLFHYTVTVYEHVRDITYLNYEFRDGSMIDQMIQHRPEMALMYIKYGEHKLWFHDQITKKLTNKPVNTQRKKVYLQLLKILNT